MKQKERERAKKVNNNTASERRNATRFQIDKQDGRINRKQQTEKNKIKVYNFLIFEPKNGCINMNCNTKIHEKMKSSTRGNKQVSWSKAVGWEGIWDAREEFPSSSAPNEEDIAGDARVRGTVWKFCSWKRDTKSHTHQQKKGVRKRILSRACYNIQILTQVAWIDNWNNKKYTKISKSYG